MYENAMYILPSILRIVSHVQYVVFLLLFALFVFSVLKVT